MQINEKNIGAVIKGMDTALGILKEKESALQSISEQTTSTNFDFEKFCRAIGKLVRNEISRTVAEIEGLKVQIEELKEIQRRIESNIVLASPGEPSKLVLG